MRGFVALCFPLPGRWFAAPWLSDRRTLRYGNLICNNYSRKVLPTHAPFACLVVFAKRTKIRAVSRETLGFPSLIKVALQVSIIYPNRAELEPVRVAEKYRE